MHGLFKVETKSAMFVSGIFLIALHFC